MACQPHASRAGHSGGGYKLQIMACQPHAGRAGHGGSGRGGHGGKFPKQNEPGTLPCKGGEVRACKDLEGNVFTI